MKWLRMLSKALGGLNINSLILILKTILRYRNQFSVVPMVGHRLVDTRRTPLKERPLPVCSVGNAFSIPQTWLSIIGRTL